MATTLIVGKRGPQVLERERERERERGREGERGRETERERQRQRETDRERKTERLELIKVADEFVERTEEKKNKI